MLFFISASLIPVMELVVIALLDVMNATWYYGFFALFGWVTLAASSLVCLYHRGHGWSAAVLAAVTGLYYVVFLVGYYTTMHGDRPRWAEATTFLQRITDVQASSMDKPEIYASVPGVVAFYLGVDPTQTMDNGLVRPVPS